MGPGVDPHLYLASASDILKLRRAQVIFYVGLHLEGKMHEIFEKLKGEKRRVYAVADAIPRDLLLTPAQFQGNYDPHIWFDVTLWQRCIDQVVTGLTDFDPEGATDYRGRAEAYAKRLAELHDWVTQQIKTLPPARRRLVTSHDAFNYFGRAYSFEVVGLQGVSTVTEAGMADFTNLVQFIRRHKIPAVFVESSVPPKAIERISAEAGVKIGGELFSDATGTPGHLENGYDVGTYEGMVRHNVNTIVQALR
jgi:manganese/zinc/iron transport system substrate-binding protein